MSIFDWLIVVIVGLVLTRVVALSEIEGKSRTWQRVVMEIAMLAFAAYALWMGVYP